METRHAPSCTAARWGRGCAWWTTLGRTARTGTDAGLAYVETDAGTDLGEAMVSDGYAEAWAPPSAAVPARMTAYRAVQRQAQSARRGAWANCASLGR